MYFQLGWVFIALHGLCLAAVTGATLLCCAGFSLWWLLLWQSAGSSVRSCSSWPQRAQVSIAVAHGISSCGTRAQLSHSMWHLPGPRIEPLFLHQQTDSYPQYHQGSPFILLLIHLNIVTCGDLTQSGIYRVWS